MSNIKLIALDLDGTLLTNNGTISLHTIDVIEKAKAQGSHVVISTGRPYCGLPIEAAKKAGIEYAITANGGAVYEIQNKKCIWENAMEPQFILPIIEFLLSKDIHFDTFISGDGFSASSKLEVAKKLDIPEALKEYIIHTRVRLDDICAYIEENHLSVQKVTINFYPDQDNTFVDREEVKAFLMSNPELEVVCGGYNNLEFTKAGVTKGNALAQLASRLNIPMENTMAIGDTENDLSIIQAAGIGIAMGNATEEIKQAAFAVTLSNENDGVAAAIEKYVLEI